MRGWFGHFVVLIGLRAPVGRAGSSFELCQCVKFCLTKKGKGAMPDKHSRGPSSSSAQPSFITLWQPCSLAWLSPCSWPVRVFKLKLLCRALPCLQPSRASRTASGPCPSMLKRQGETEVCAVAWGSTILRSPCWPSTVALFTRQASTSLGLAMLFG